MRFRPYDGRRHSDPTVIRGVVRYYKDAKNAGLAKIARDRKSGYQIERVRAQRSRLCASRRCTHEIIETGDFFARVSDGTMRSIGRASVPATKDYHFGCVPKGAKYLVRFFEA